MGKEFATADKFSDTLPGFFSSDTEGEGGVRDGAVGDLVIDRKSVATPVATSLAGFVGVNNYFGTTAMAFEGDSLSFVSFDFRGARADDEPGESGKIFY